MGAENVIVMKINGDVVSYTPSERLSIGCIITPFLKTSYFMSNQAILATVQEACLLLDELGMFTKTTKTKDSIRYFRRLMRKEENEGDRQKIHEALTTWFCELVMQAEGLGRLQGFTYCATENNEGSVTVKANLGNPEMRPMGNI